MDVKLPGLFDIYLNDYLEMYNYKREKPKEEKRYFKQTDDPAWQADVVYQLYTQNEAEAEYILCWSNRIVYINYEEIPTSEQIAITVEKLSK
ncbi:MAG: hypothetical protein WCD89_20720 [Anaerocolumna sp.]